MISNHGARTGTSAVRLPFPLSTFRFQLSPQWGARPPRAHEPAPSRAKSSDQYSVIRYWLPDFSFQRFCFQLWPQWGSSAVRLPPVGRTCPQSAVRGPGAVGIMVLIFLPRMTGISRMERKEAKGISPRDSKRTGIVGPDSLDALNSLGSLPALLSLLPPVASFHPPARWASGP